MPHISTINFAILFFQLKKGEKMRFVNVIEIDDKDPSVEVRRAIREDLISEIIEFDFNSPKRCLIRLFSDGTDNSLFVCTPYDEILTQLDIKK